MLPIMLCLAAAVDGLWSERRPFRNKFTNVAFERWPNDVGFGVGSLWSASAKGEAPILTLPIGH